MDILADNLSRYGEVSRVSYRPTYENTARCVQSAMNFRQQKKLSRVFREIKPDIVHINQQTAEDALDLLLAAQLSSIPLLSTIHIARSATSLGARFGSLRDLVTSEVLRRVNAFHITVANSAAQELLVRFPFLTADRVRVVYNGVRYKDTPPEISNEIRTLWSVKPGETLLGSVGRLTSQKDPGFALEIVADLRRKGLSVRYIWIGDGPMRTLFFEKARQLDIDDCVILDGWRNDVADRLSALDILLMPSRFEGMPLALLEAMSAGLCCLANDLDGMREAIRQEVTGYLCAPGNLDSWCACLEFLIQNSERRTTVGEKARNLARHRFSTETMAKNTLGLYEEVVKASAVASSW